MSDPRTFPDFSDLPPNDPRRHSLSSKLERLLDVLLPHQENTTSLLLEINRKLDIMADQIDALGQALGDNIAAQQAVLDDFTNYLTTAHPNTTNDPRVQNYINNLQDSTNRLSNAHTSYLSSTGAGVAPALQPGQKTSTDPATGNTVVQGSGTNANMGAVSPEPQGTGLPTDTDRVGGTGVGTSTGTGTVGNTGTAGE